MDFVRMYVTLHPILQLLCAVLIAFAFLCAVLMWAQSRRVIRLFDALKIALNAVRKPEKTERRTGLSLEAVEEMRVHCERLPAAAMRLWEQIDERIESYTSPDGREGWFLTAAPRTLLLEEAVAGQHYHASFWQAVPGLLTASGLLLTFVSILVALADVRVISVGGAETVTGTTELINGLSAKFISSIIGLSLSILFVLMERKVCERRMTNAYEALMNCLDILLPLLTPTRIQLDIQMYAARQATSMSNISSDFVNKFTGVFQQQIAPAFAAGVSEELALQMQREFRPTMQQMSATLERLQGAIERLESQKQQSVAEEVRSLLQSLESSIRSSLDEMGRSFHTSLATAATEEFTGIAGTLRSTGEVLRNMNAQFDHLQSALEAVIQEARRTTEGQLENGREQLEAMTRLMERLIIRLNDSSRTNLDAVTASLTGVVGELSQKVTQLSADMVGAVRSATADAQQTANAVVVNAGQWTEMTTKRLGALVSGIEARSEDFREAGKTLLGAHEGMRQTLQENQQALASIKSLTGQLEALSMGLVSVSKASSEQTEAQFRAVSMTSQATASLKSVAEAALERHETLLRAYRTAFEKYQIGLANIDRHLASIFGSIHEGMVKYNGTVEANFRGIVDAANKTIPPMASALRAETDQLAEKLEELSEVLDTGIARLRR